jgi:hypothetical protein
MVTKMIINLNLIFILITIIIAIFCITFVVAYKVLLKEQHTSISRIISSYDLYMKILTTNMDKAFNIIYKDRILIFSLEATTPDAKEINRIAKDHIKLVLKLIGPSLHKEFILLFGDEETFLFNISEYFNERFDEDEIRSVSQDNLINDEGT